MKSCHNDVNDDNKAEKKKCPKNIRHIQIPMIDTLRTCLKITINCLSHLPEPFLQEFEVLEFIGNVSFKKKKKIV
jgi:hypothetical protein